MIFAQNFVFVVVFLCFNVLGMDNGLLCFRGCGGCVSNTSNDSRVFHGDRNVCWFDVSLLLIGFSFIRGFFYGLMAELERRLKYVNRFHGPTGSVRSGSRVGSRNK